MRRAVSFVGGVTLAGVSVVLLGCAIAAGTLIGVVERCGESRRRAARR